MTDFWSSLFFLVGIFCVIATTVRAWLDDRKFASLRKRDSIALTEIHHNLEAIRAMLELRERK